jgi:hypothetical protein
MYNIQNNNFNIEALILSQEDIYRFKLDNNYIIKYNNTIKGKYDNILSAANIHLTTKEMESFNASQDPWILIYISSNFNEVDKLIIGSTISQVNSLISPSERIYHYGKINSEEKIVYKLKGKAKYHLMRLELGSNNGLIGWSVKRNNSDKNYKSNDTDLSFVTEKWINGRGLLTMYIERGEDIYLSIFPKKKIKDVKLTNFVFKYLNSAKNGDFKNYIVKHDSLTYDRNNKKITINKITNIPFTFDSINYIKVIDEDDFVNEENINTIANIESTPFIEIKGKISENNVNFFLLNMTDPQKTYYINAYTTIIENFFDVEFISYAGYILTKEEYDPDVLNKDSNSGLMIASIVIASVILFIVIIRFIWYCCNEC